MLFIFNHAVNGDGLDFRAFFWWETHVREISLNSFDMVPCLDHGLIHFAAVSPASFLCYLDLR